MADILAAVVFLVAFGLFAAVFSWATDKLP
jgi:hypothetical protein